MLFWMLLQGLKEAINYDVFIVQHGKAVAVYGSSPKGIHLREQAFRKPIQTEHYTVVGFDYLRVLYDDARFLQGPVNTLLVMTLHTFIVI